MFCGKNLYNERSEFYKEMIELNTIYHEDCLEGMKRIPDGSVDLIICDLPYGVLHKSNSEAVWDKPLPMDKLWEQYLRITKPSAAIILFGQGMFTAQLMTSQPKLWRYNLIWNKGKRITGFLNAKRMPLRCHEDICVFYRKRPTYHPQMTIGPVCHKRNTRGEGNVNRCWGKMKVAPTTISNEKYPVSILTFEKDYPVLHPTQKPVALIGWLIKTYSNPGETVLDNCIGSGRTAIAALRTGRQFIGFEVTKKYFDLSMEEVSCEKRKMESMIMFK